MERPFAFIGFSYLTGLLVAFFFGSGAALIGVILGLVALLALLIRYSTKTAIKNPPLALAVAGITLALGVFLLAETQSGAYATKYDEKEYAVSGKLIGFLEEREGTSIYQMQIDVLAGAPVQPFQVRLYSTKQFYFTPYDNLHCTVRLKAFTDEPGFSPRKSYHSQGYSMNAYHQRQQETILSPAESKPITAGVMLLRQSILRLSDSIFAETNGEIIAAMLLGERGRLNDATYEQFKLAGANHILVVSGMHLAIIASGLLFLLQRLRIPRRLRFILAICAIVCYILLAGMGKSVVRSGIMFLIFICAQLLGEEGDGLNALGFSVLCICGVNSWAAADIGFLLSVAATAGIIQFAGRFTTKFSLPQFFPRHKLRGKLWYGVVAALGVSIAAYLFVMPVLLLFSPSLNPVSILSGTLLALPSGGILVLAIFSLLLTSIPFVAAAAAPLIIACNLLIKLMLWVVEQMARLGGIMPVLFDGQLLFAGLLIITALCLLYRPSRSVRICWAVTAAGLICVAVVSSSLYFSQIPLLLTADTGKGIFAAVVKGREAVVLACDGYMGDRAVGILKQYGVQSIPFLCFDPEQSEQIAQKLMNAFLVGTIYTPSETAPMQAQQILYKRDTTFTAFADIQVSLDYFGKLITVSYGDISILLERSPITSVPLSADVVLTEQIGTNHHSAFTVLRTDAIMDIKAPGRYIFSKGKAYSMQLHDPTQIRRID